MDDSLTAKLFSDGVYLVMMAMMLIMIVRLWGGGVKAHEHPWLYAPAG
jgi:hypothetical protein